MEVSGAAKENKGYELTTRELYSASHRDGSEEALSAPALSKPTGYVEKVDSWWLYELVAWSIAVAALLGIVLLLSARDDRPLPEWTITTHALGKTITTKLTINTMISIISTVLKSTIMIPIAASIAQLKWLWFHEGNKLSDIQLFDAANRGPLGSVIMMWQMRARRLVCLGCLIVILMLGVDFSLQAAVTYPSRPTKVGSATIPAKHTYKDVALAAPSGIAQIQGFEVVRPLKAAMQFVAYDIEAAFEIVPDCPTGNCTWSKSFATLGVCNECYDATSILNTSCTWSLDDNLEPAKSCNYSWPGTQDLSFNTWFNEIPASYWLTSDASESSNTTRYSKTMFASSADHIVWDLFNYFFKDFKEPLAILSVLQPVRKDGNLTTVIATQCALKTCVKKFTTNMTNSVLTEKLIDTFEDKTAVTSTGNVDAGILETSDYIIKPPDSFFEGMNSSTPRTFVLGVDTKGAIMNTIRSFFTGSVEEDLAQHSTLSSSGDGIQHLYNLTQPGIFAMMDALAGNMTNAFRMSNTNASATNNLYASGDVLQDKTYVHVRWAWLALPAFALLLTLIFLLLTMNASTKHKSMLWKNSALAPFYYPLTKEGRSKVQEAASPWKMENVASGLKVQWMNTDQGLRLVQR